MESSKLVKIIINHEITVEIAIIGCGYAFTLVNEDQNSKKILTSAPQYGSEEEARTEADDFIEYIRSKNRKIGFYK